MKRFISFAQIDVSVLTAIKEIRKVGKIENPDQALIWDKAQHNCIKQFKQTVLDHGLAIQERRCAWCTLLIGEEGHRTVHRDHIAPKKKYPQWTFSPQNLVLSCEYCNGFASKRDLDTIKQCDPCYENCEFWLVHPYLDDPDLHLEFRGSDENAKIAIVGKTDKGNWTITNLHLDSPGMTTERAKDFLYLRDSSTLPPQYRTLLAKATGREAE